MVVFAQFCKAGLGDIRQLDLGLSGGSGCNGAFHDVLLAAAGCLNHLVDGAVAIFVKISFDKKVCNVDDNHRQFINIPVLKFACRCNEVKICHTISSTYYLFCYLSKFW